jgi:hypothetical protein
VEGLKKGGRNEGPEKGGRNEGLKKGGRNEVGKKEWSRLFGSRDVTQPMNKNPALNVLRTERTGNNGKPQSEVCLK